MRKTNLLRLLLTATVALAAGLFIASPVRAAVGDIWETNNGMILRFTSGGGTPSTFVSNLSNPKGIVFDGSGHVLVADAGRGTILRFTTFDATGATFASGLSSPVGLAFDQAGNLFEGDAGSGTIFKFAPDGTKTTFATGVGAPAGLAFDNSGNLFVADFSGGSIVKITPDGTKSPFATGLGFPAGLAFDNSGNLFEADSSTGKIFKFTPDGTKSTFVATGLSRPYGLAFEASGNLIVGDNDTGATLRFTPTGAKSTVFSSSFNNPQFVAVEPAPHQILNVSTRGFVDTGEHVLIGGFIVGGNGPVGTTVVVRAIGPSLSAFGITDALQDPILELHDASGTAIASNDNYKDAPISQRVGASLAPTDDRESALQLVLHGGAFTAIVRGTGGTTGTAVVEVYNLQ
jgi:sugar lactone lactonase YvrE